MHKKPSSVVDKPLLSWVWSQNRWLQTALVLVAASTAIVNVLPLELQKRIVDDAIMGQNIDRLFWYCSIYLVVITASTALKYLISILQTIIGQRTLFDMRSRFFQHILALPLSFYRNTQPGMVVTALTKELATVGDYAGMALAIPVTNLLLLLAFGAYLFWLNPLLAVLSLSIYPIVILLVPILQKRVNRYNRKRIDTTREMSNKLGESIEGLHEIRSNGAFDYEGQRFDDLVARLKRIRIVWNLYRQAVKRINSFFVNIGRFLIFAVGGYFAIEGRLEIGALVAFLSAQEKIYDPWKELIEFYQAHQIAKVTYRRTRDYFDVEPQQKTGPSKRTAYELQGSIDVEHVSVLTAKGVNLLSDVSIALKAGEHLAVVGFSGSGKSTLAKCIGQLQQYSAGRIHIDQQEVSKLSNADIAKNVGFVSQSPFIFKGTVEDNLVYGLVAGNQIETKASLDDKIRAIQQANLFKDILHFGLNSVLDSKRHASVIQGILKVRQEFHEKYKDDLLEHIEFYDIDKVLYYATLAENILFAEAKCEAYAVDNLPENDLFMAVLSKCDLLEPFVDLGAECAKIISNEQHQEPVPDLPIDRLPKNLTETNDIENLHYRVEEKGKKNISKRDRGLLLEIALRHTPKNQPAIDISKELEMQILAARRLFQKEIQRLDSQGLTTCHMSSYMTKQTIFTNILFGKVKNQADETKQKIRTLVHQIMIEKEFIEEIIDMGLKHGVGSKGENLSGGQRQKLAIARVLLKDPPVIIMDEATSSLDNESQHRIQSFLENNLKGKRTVIWIAHRLDTIQNFDKIAVMQQGKIVEIDTYPELMKNKNGTLYHLIKGNAKE